MKVLFLGEGKHDIGPSELTPNTPRPARGVVPTLARRVCGSISHESVALAWWQIPRFNPSAKKHGFQAKVPAAVLVAIRRFGCVGTVLVVDQDTDPGRAAELQAGVDAAKKTLSEHIVVAGQAIRFIEAWTLGVPEKIAEELQVEVSEVRALYPGGVLVEELSERSGKEDHRPKKLLQRIAALKHQEDSMEFREAIAERTVPVALETACPKGFAPFAQSLRSAFGCA